MTTHYPSATGYLTIDRTIDGRIRVIVHEYRGREEVTAEIELTERNAFDAGVELMLQDTEKEELF